MAGKGLNRRVLVLMGFLGVRFSRFPYVFALQGIRASGITFFRLQGDKV